MLEFLDIDFGDISKSESDRYRNDSRRCGRFCKTRPALGEPPSSGDLAPCPFSTSKLFKENEKKAKINQLNKLKSGKGFFSIQFRVLKRVSVLLAC